MIFATIRTFVRGVFVFILLATNLASADPMIGELEDPHKHLLDNIVNFVDGEQHNLLTGQLGYYRDDFVFEGNGPTIRLGRKFYPEYGYPFEFRNMALEIPKIEFTSRGIPFQYPTVCAGGGECGPDYRVPPAVEEICTGLKMKDFETHYPGGGDDPFWIYGPEDLTSGIKLVVGGKRINLFPKESILAQPNRFPANAEYVSPANWYAHCSGTTWVVHSPSGHVYNLNKYERLPATVGDSSGRTTVLVSSVTDPYGRSLTYNYDSRVAAVKIGDSVINGNGLNIPGYAFYKWYLTGVTASDGRAMSVAYNSDNTISSIEGNSTVNQRRLSYSYAGSDDQAHLHRVTRQDNTYWQFSFGYGEDISSSLLHPDRKDEAGSFITQIKTPLGLTIDYQQVPHDPRTHREYPNCQLNTLPSYTVLNSGGPFQIVLSQRSISGPGLENIQSGMVWQYEYHEISSGDRAATFVRGPGNSIKYLFRRINHFDGHSDTGYVDNGKLLSTSIYAPGSTYAAAGNPLKTITTSWIKRPAILDENAINFAADTYCQSLYDHAPLGAWLVSFHNAMNRVPGTITTTQGIHSFSRTYSAHDLYDNPQQMIEAGNTGSRVSNFTYQNDQANWIIGQLKDETVEGGGPGTIRSFNTYGQLATEQEYGLSTHTYTYFDQGTSLGELREISWDRSGTTLTRQFDDYHRGIPQVEIDPDFKTVTRTVNDNGTVATEIDRNLNPTHYGYDSLRRTVLIDTPLYDDTVFTWSNDGRTRTTAQGNYREVTKFDALARVTSNVESDFLDPANNVETAFEYDSAGRLSKEYLQRTVSGGSTTGLEYSFDALNRITSVTHSADQTTTLFCYETSCPEAAGTLDFGYATTDPRGFTTVRNFTAYGEPLYLKLIEVHDLSESINGSNVFNRVTTIDRNLYNDVTRVARGSTERTYEYSAAMPRLIQHVTEPETGVTTYTYRNDGTLWHKQTGGSGFTYFTHDNNERITNIDYPGPTPDIRFEYHEDGQLSQAISGEGTTVENRWTYQLNAENDIRQESLSVDGQVFSIDYGFDNLGQVNSLTYPSGRIVTQASDVLGRTRSITNYVNHAGYFPNGAIAAIEYANGQTMTMTQNARRLPENLTTNIQGQATLVDLTYGYDTNNNIVSITDPFLGDKALGYDAVNRLTNAGGPWGSGAIDYDNNDNIISKQIGTESLLYTHDPILNRLTGITDSGSQVYSFGYDVYGNVTSNGTNTFTYNDANNLVTSGNNAYQYDAHDRRVLVDKSGDKQYYAYSNDGQLMFRYDANDQQTTDYIYLAGELVAKHEEKPDPPAQAATPTINPNGGSFLDSVTVSLSGATPGSSIYYTKDGSTPTTASTLYTAAFELTGNTLVQAIAFASGNSDSTVASASFTVTPTPTAAAPEISPDGGSHVASSVDVSLSSTTPGASIYYTTDGSPPTTSSTLYTGIFSLTASTTVKAISTAPGHNESGESSVVFDITWPTAPSPTINVVINGQNAFVYINSSVPGNTRYYSYKTGGFNDPPYPNTVYTSYLGFSTGPSSKKVKVNARVTAPGYNPSAVSTVSFTIPGHGGGGR